MKLIGVRLFLVVNFAFLPRFSTARSYDIEEIDRLKDWSKYRSENMAEMVDDVSDYDPLKDEGDWFLAEVMDKLAKNQSESKKDQNKKSKTFDNLIDDFLS